VAVYIRTSQIQYTSFRIFLAITFHFRSVVFLSHIHSYTTDLVCQGTKPTGKPFVYEPMGSRSLEPQKSLKIVRIFPFERNNRVQRHNVNGCHSRKKRRVCHSSFARRTFVSVVRVWSFYLTVFFSFKVSFSWWKLYITITW